MLCLLCVRVCVCAHVCVSLGGVMAHPTAYKGPCHCKRSEAVCEIQLIVITGSRGLHTHYLLAKEAPSHFVFALCYLISIHPDRGQITLQTTDSCIANISK